MSGQRHHSQGPYPPMMNDYTMSNAANNNNNIVPSHHQANPHQIMPNEPYPQQNPPDTFITNTQSHEWYQTQTHPHDFHHQHHPQQQPQQQEEPNNCSSCRSVASAIRSIRPNIGTELEVDLGCYQEFDDCSVPNMQAFDVIDRYSDERGF